MRFCQACQQAEGIYHMTVRVDVVGPIGNPKTKLAQFWLCAACERASQDVLRADAEKETRMAKRISADPPKREPMPWIR